MRFFTQQWLDEMDASVIEEYLIHLQKLDLPDRVNELAETNTHDGVLLAADHDEAESLLYLHIRCDNMNGEFDLHLTFEKARIDQESMNLLRIMTARPGYEILYQEVDRIDNEYQYSFILHPAGEVHIQFKDVQVIPNPTYGEEEN